MALGLGVSHTKSAPYLFWCPNVFYKWRYVFYLLLDLTRQPYRGVMQTCEWELLAVCQQPDTVFDEYRDSDS